MSILKIKPFIIDDTTANDAFSRANAAFDRANSAYGAANNATDTWVRTQANNAYDKANSAGSFANGAFVTANASYISQNTTADFANAAFITANTAYAWGNHAAAGYATTSYVGTQISNLVDSAPTTLDTLNELAAALGDDANFSTTITTMIGVTNSFANGAFVTANSGASFANGAFDRANAAYAAANSAAGSSTDSWARTQANNAYDTANSAASFANGSFERANASYTAQNTTAVFANSAFDKANNALPKAGGTMTGNLVISSTAVLNIQNTTSTTSNTTGALLVVGGAGIKGNVYTGAIRITGGTANGLTFADGTTQYTANVIDSWVRTQANNAYNTANAAFTTANNALPQSGGTLTGNLVLSSTSVLEVQNLDFSTSNTTGSVIVVGGVGIKGNVYTGSITITGPASNGLTFADGTTQYTANGSDAWAKTQANNAYDTANSAGSFANGAFVTANASFIKANSSYASQNITADFANAAFTTANSNASFANGAFVTANSAADFANGAFARANAAYAQANTGGSGGGMTYTASNTAPSSPKAGDQWYYNATDVLYEYINDGTSNSWVDMTTPTAVVIGGTNYPAFSATLSGDQSGLSSGVYTKITFDTEQYDTDNCFNTSTNVFTPTRAGYYLITLSVGGGTTTTITRIIGLVYKNGSQYQITSDGPAGGTLLGTGTGSVVLYMNGTTDYIEAYGSVTGTGTLRFESDYTRITGTLMRPA